MYTKNPPSRKQLNNAQIQTLVTLYQYRFAGSNLLASQLNKKSVYKQLRILEDQDLIGKRYESNYRLRGRPAAYYLSTKGVQTLMSANVLSDVKMKYAYKARTVSEQFIDHSLDILAISNRLNENYADSIKLFPKVALDKEAYGYFPKPLQDAYLRLKNGKNQKQYFLDLFQEGQSFVAIARKLQVYVEYFNAGYWDDTGTAFPTLLIVLEDPGMQKKLSRYVTANIEELCIYFTDKTVLLRSDAKDLVWHDSYEPEAIYTLEQLKSPEVA